MEISKTREVGAIPKYWAARAVLDAVKEKEKETDAAVKKAGFGLSPPIFGTAWIRFKIVDDRTNEVIPGVKLTVNHQDGIYKDLVSDSHGTISFENIKRGSCDITGDAMKSWRATLFIPQPLCEEDFPTHKSHQPRQVRIES